MPTRLLITDDEPLILLSLVDLLGGEDVDVTLASDGLEALAVARQLGDTLDVLVTDLDMPRMAGGDLIRSLRLDWPSLPVVVVSGSAPLPIYAVWPSTKLPMAKTRLFIEALAARLKRERL